MDTDFGTRRVTDEENSEYVYFQSANGLIKRGLVGPTGTAFERFDTLQGSSSKSKLATSYVDGSGALLLFQNSSSSSTMFASEVSRSMFTISNEAIP
jgi:hypothetical protein